MLDNYDLSSFLDDRVMKRTIGRNVELIGQAARRYCAASGCNDL